MDTTRKHVKGPPLKYRYEDEPVFILTWIIVLPSLRTRKHAVT